MLKVGLVGIGGISYPHFEGWKSLEDAELVAVCDVRPECLEQYADKRCYTDLDEMLEKEELDILDICVPTYLHVDFSVKAMEKGINVLCEKPLSLNPADAERVYRTARKNNVKFMVAQVVRFMPYYELLRELCQTKKYGKLLSGYMKRMSGIPKWSYNDWMRDSSWSGMVPFDMHIHDLDFLVYALGVPTAVHRHRAFEPAKSDAISVVYEFGNAFVTVESAWYDAAYPFSAGFRFQFENAVVSFEQGKFVVYRSDGQIIDLSSNLEDEAKKDGLITMPKTDAYGEEIRYFAQCVRDDVWPDKVKMEEVKAVLEIVKGFSS